MQTTQATIRSTVLGNERRLWVQQPQTIRPTIASLILLDGEYYVEKMDAPALLGELQSAGAIPPLTVVYVSHLDGQTRWHESFCNDKFARFICDEILPWTRNRCDAGHDVHRFFIGGLSLTGLAAAHTSLVCPGAFDGVLCQSASFWWSNERLIDDVRNGNALSSKFRITCGLHETQEYVEHGPNLIQRFSQLSSNRAMRDALLEKGHVVSYEECDGGHDITSWKRGLPKSLLTLLPSNGEDDERLS